MDMEFSDNFLCSHHDGDPSYLSEIMDVDFNDMSELWTSTINDTDLVHESERVEKYCPIAEDISMDDYELYNIVEAIEHE